MLLHVDFIRSIEYTSVRGTEMNYYNLLRLTVSINQINCWYRVKCVCVRSYQHHRSNITSDSDSLIIIIGFNVCVCVHSPNIVFGGHMNQPMIEWH